MKRTLTLKPSPARVAPSPPTPADPLKIALSVALGLRYVSRGGRYIQQVNVLIPSPEPCVAPERTWVDIPLVPEVYG